MPCALTNKNSISGTHLVVLAINTHDSRSRFDEKNGLRVVMAMDFRMPVWLDPYSVNRNMQVLKHCSPRKLYHIKYVMEFLWQCHLSSPIKIQIVHTKVTEKS